MDLTIRVLSDLSSVDPAAWDALDHGDSPFLEHGFLRALEVTGSIGDESGWSPAYVVAELGATNAKTLVGAVPCFLKDHSYGEYIFDWAWARASARARVPYYPKLVAAAPVTPATGRRILLRRPQAGDDPALRGRVAAALVEAVKALADALEASSIHWLFTTADEQALLEDAGFMPRASFQYHFHNHGYADFEAFLATLNSRKRKQIRKERRRVQEAIDGVEFIPGDAADAHTLAQLDRFYRDTTQRHGGRDYLRPGFFHELARRLPHRVQVACVRRRGETIAGALYLETEAALYGRYWGACEDIEFLHFETACYAGIEHCIRRGLPRFEAGAQGEHKLLRGFTPQPTYSSHWIRHPELRGAVHAFLIEEAAALPSYMNELEQYGPYRRDGARPADETDEDP